MDKLADRRKPCQVPWASLSPLVQEVLRLGGEISSIVPGPGVVQAPGPREKLPAGHRYFPDDLREQEARVLAWLITKFNHDAWFVTLTFEDYIEPDRPLMGQWLRKYDGVRPWANRLRKCDGVKPSANRVLAMWLARLNQAYKAIPGAALLKSVAVSEWQRRGVVHFHLLIFGKKLGSLSRKRWEFRWRMIGGGFAAVYEAEVAAAPYLVKHQIKDRPGGNLDIGGSWRGIEPPRDVGQRADVSNDTWGEWRQLLTRPNQKVAAK